MARPRTPAAPKPSMIDLARRGNALVASSFLVAALASAIEPAGGKASADPNLTVVGEFVALVALILALVGLLLLDKTRTVFGEGRGRRVRNLLFAWVAFMLFNAALVSPTLLIAAPSTYHPTSDAQYVRALMVAAVALEVAIPIVPALEGLPRSRRTGALALALVGLVLLVPEFSQAALRGFGPAVGSLFLALGVFLARPEPVRVP